MNILEKLRSRFSGSDRIFISKEAHEIYKELSRDKGEVPTKAFQTMRDVFLTAFVIGYVENVSKPLGQSNKEGIFDLGVLKNDPNAYTVLQTIALHKTKDPQILLDDNKMIKLAEEYANGGIDILVKKIKTSQANQLEEAALYMQQLLEEEIEAEGSDSANE